MPETESQPRDEGAVIGLAKCPFGYEALNCRERRGGQCARRFNAGRTPLAMSECYRQRLKAKDRKPWEDA